MLSHKVSIDRHVQAQLKKYPSEKERNQFGYRIGKLYFNVGEYEIARRYVSAYLTVAPESPAGHRLLGETLEKLGKRDDALQSYRASLELDPTQKDILLKVCELMALEGVTLDPSLANHWCQQAEQHFPNHPALFCLKEKMLLNDKDSDPSKVENLILTELKQCPTDAGLRIRLLQHLIQSNKITEAYQHALDVEKLNTNIFSENLSWYETVQEVLIRYQREYSNTDVLTFEFWIFIAFVYDKVASLCLRELSFKTIDVCAKYVFLFDQMLLRCSQNLTHTSDRQLIQEFLTHYRGQLCLHLSTLIYKKVKTDQFSYKEASKLSIPLLLSAWLSGAPEVNAFWVNHTSEQSRKWMRRWHLEASYRCSQAGHVLTSIIGERKSNFIDKLTQICSGNWRERLYKSIFVNRDQVMQMQTSYFVTCAELAEVRATQPASNELAIYDEAAQLLHPHSLHHVVWIALNRKLCEVKCTVFNGLQYSVDNLSNCAAESLNQLDVQAFLYCTTLCVKANLTEGRQSLYPSLDKPSVLPASITEHLCTMAQDKWFNAVYRVYMNQCGPDLGSLRMTLTHGIEVVRCIGNHGLAVRLLVQLANAFTQHVKFVNKENEIEYVEARAKLYWNTAIPLLERIKNDQLIKYPKNKNPLFEYNGKDLTPNEVTIYIEEGKLFLAGQLKKQNEHEKALELLQGLKSPYASYMQAQIYRQLAADHLGSNKEHVTSEMRSQHIILLSKARDYAYLTLDRLREPSVDKRHPLNSVLASEIENIESQLSRIDPDIAAHHNDLDNISDENLSSAGSVGDHTQMSSFHQIPNFTNGRNTPRNRTSRTLHSTPYRSVPEPINLDSVRRTEARPSPERLDAQIRQMAASKDAVITHILEQNRTMLDSHRSLSDALRDAISGTTRNTEEFKDLKKSIDTIQGDLKKCVDNIQEDLNSIKEAVDLIKIEVSDLKKDTAKFKASQFNEDDLYGLEDDYAVDFSTPQAAMPAGSAFNQNNLYTNFAGRSLNYPAPGMFPGGLPPAVYGYQTLPGALPYSDQHIADFRNIAGLAQPGIPLQSFGLVPPSLSQPHPQNLPFATGSGHAFTKLPTDQQTYSVAKTEVVQPQPIISKNTAVNVVITSSDPIPTTSVTTSVLSVTIPPQHLRGNLPPKTTQPHNYQIPLPASLPNFTSSVIASSANPLPLPISSQNVLSNVSSPNYPATSKEDVFQNSALTQSQSIFNSPGSIFNSPSSPFATPSNVLNTSVFDSSRSLFLTPISEMNNTSNVTDTTIEPETQIETLSSTPQSSKMSQQNSALVGLLKSPSVLKESNLSKQNASSQPQKVIEPPISTLGGFTFSTAPTFKPKVNEPKPEPPKKEIPVKTSPFASFSFTPKVGTPATSTADSKLPTPLMEFKPQRRPSAELVHSPSQTNDIKGFFTHTSPNILPFSSVVGTPTSNLSQSKLATPKFGDRRSDAAVSSSPNDAEEFIPTAEFKPVIPLPDIIDIKTGEEDENVLFCERAKLLRFDNNNKEWKERGLGNMKILASGIVRLLMRREQILKVCCNHQVTKAMKFEAVTGNEKAVRWAAQDYSENELKSEIFTIRFKTADQAKNFIQVLRGVQEQMDEGNFIEDKTDSKVTSTSVSTAAPSTVGSSWGDQFKPKPGSWECQSCYTTNEAKVTHCMACTNPKEETVIKKASIAPPTTVPATAAPSWGEQFKPKAGSWECKTCYTRNEGKVTHCVACTNPRDETVTKKDKNLGFGGATTQEFTFGIPPTSAEKPSKVDNVPQTVSSWGDKFKPKVGSWDCDGCYLNNEAGTDYCISCEHPRDDTVPKKESKGLNLAPDPTAPKFTFGIPQSAAGTGFTFGIPKKPETEVAALPVTSESAIDLGAKSFNFNFSKSAPTFNPTEDSTPKKDVKYTFGSPDKFEFVFTPRSPRKSTGGGDESDGNVSEDEGEHIHFTPVVPLPDKIDVKTGEENEEVLYCHRAKLFRFASGEWKERGVGDIKILKDKSTGKLRILMRRDQVLKICLNHALTSDIKYLVKDEKSWLFSAPDYSDGEITHQQFTIRFKNPEIAQEFKAAIDSAVDGSGNESNSTGAQSRPKEDEVEVIYELHVSPEEEERAIALKLPRNFYSYLRKPACEGCPGCENDSEDDGESKETVLKSTPSTKQSLSLIRQPTLNVSSSESNTSLLSNSSSSTFSTPQKVSEAKGVFSGQKTVESTPNIFSGTPQTDVTPKSIFGNNAFKFGSSIFGRQPNPADTESAFSGSNTSLSNANIFSGQNIVSATPVFGASNSTLTPSSTSGTIFGGTITSIPGNIFGGGTSPVTTPSSGNVFGGGLIKPSKLESKIQGKSPLLSETPNTEPIFTSTTTKASTAPIFGGAQTVTPSLFGTKTAQPVFGETVTTSATSVFGATPLALGKPVFGASTADTKIPSVKETDSSNDKPILKTGPGLSFAGLVGQSDKTVAFGNAPKESDKTDEFKDKPILKAEPGLSFACLAASNAPAFANEGKNQNFMFEGAGTLVFGGKSTPKRDKNKKKDKSTDNAEEDEEVAEETTGDDYDPHYEPIVPLPDKIVVSTGEEDEQRMFCERAKLYRFDSNTREWKERGVGDFKLLYHPELGTYRFLLRREQVHKIVLNQLLLPDLELKTLNSSDRAFCWYGMNHAEDTPCLEELALRFKNSQIAEDFAQAVKQCQEKLRSSPPKLPKPVTAESLTITPNLDLNAYEDDEYREEDDEEDEDDEDEDDDEDDDERSVMCEKRCTLHVRDSVSGKWQKLVLGSIQIYYDPELYCARIMMTKDDGEVVTNNIIGANTTMTMDKTACIWSSMDYAPEPPISRTLKAEFSSEQAATEFYATYQEGVQYAQSSDIVDIDHHRSSSPDTD